MLKKSLKLNYTCADCTYHMCKTECVQKPRKMCKGFCIKTKQFVYCHDKIQKCKDFKQIDWSELT